MMSIIPEFEIGLWNAWILMIYVIILNIVPLLIWSNDKDTLKKLGWGIPSSGREKNISNATSALVFAMLAYSIFLPLRLGTAWFFLGFSIYLVGATVTFLAIQKLVTAPAGKLVTTGVYRLSRNPGYLGLAMVFVGTGIAGLSWVFVLIAVVFIRLLGMSIAYEERYCLQLYGDAYREYMKTIPKWIGRPRPKQH